ncbi:annexin A13-like [Gigantopelta aegis]|uniref:annexin A13-like n=1 Tax=Gigantopelta aegis TaxID=1735272 RepID=UPI001B88BF37|nr:annexin A13-like [Gigantopelta aegis]
MTDFERRRVTISQTKLYLHKAGSKGQVCDRSHESLSGSLQEDCHSQDNRKPHNGDEDGGFGNLFGYKFGTNFKKDSRDLHKSRANRDDPHTSKPGRSAAESETNKDSKENRTTILVPASMTKTLKVYLNKNPDPHIIVRKPAGQTDGYDSDDEVNYNGHATIQGTRSFMPQHLCVALHKAMEITNETRIIRILTSCNNRQRQELKAAYKTQYRADLTEDLTRVLGADMETVILGLLMRPLDFSAKCLYDSMYGIGTDERLLTYIIVNCNPQEMKILKKKYNKAYKKDMSSDVEVETNGVLQMILLKVIAEGEKAGSQKPAANDTTANKNAANKSSTARPSASEGHVKQKGVKLSSKEKAALKSDKGQPTEGSAAFNDEREKMIAQKYAAKMASTNDMKSIVKQTKGDSEVALMTLTHFLVRKFKDPIKYIFNTLYDKFDTAGTNRTLLSYIIISRSEIDLQDIMRKFQKKYKRSLAEAVEIECRGRYKKVLLALLNPKD